MFFLCMASAPALSYRVVNDLTYLPACGAAPWPEGAVCVAGDKAAVERCFHERIKGVRHLHVREVRPDTCIDAPFLSKHRYLAQLRPADVVAWPAGAVCVAEDKSAVVCCFHERIERIALRHIREVWTARHVYGKALCKHHDLAQLPAGGVIEWPEGAVRVTRHRAGAEEVAH